jgi:hypothetical protein
VRGAPVLPDDRAGKRLSRMPVPGDHRLALVGDANARDPVRPPLPLSRARAQASVFVQISAASCSTLPGAG